MTTASGQVLSINSKEEVVVVDDFSFIKKVVDKMVSGDLGTCPYSGQVKGTYQWICSGSFARAEKEERGKGLKIVKAAQKAFTKARGVIVEQPAKQPSKTSRINDDLFHEIVDVGIGKKAKCPEITVEKLHEYLISLYPHEDQVILGKAAASACKVVKKQLAENERHRKERQEAERAVEAFLKKNPNNFLRDLKEIVDDIFLDKTIGVETSRGKLIKAVADKQNNLLWEICTRETKNYFVANPKDLKRSSLIAKKINETRITQGKHELPDWMLARAVDEKQEALREKKRQRSIAAANNFRGVKKPHSASKRGERFNGPRVKQKRHY